MKNILKLNLLMIAIYVVIIIGALVGEIKCIIKTTECNWQPIGKAEVIYTIGTFTGFGIVIGYLDIEDK